MWPNPLFPADLVTVTEEILNRKLHFLCSVTLFSDSIMDMLEVGKYEIQHGWTVKKGDWKYTPWSPWLAIYTV